MKLVKIQVKKRQESAPVEEVVIALTGDEVLIMREIWDVVLFIANVVRFFKKVLRRTT